MKIGIDARLIEETGVGRYIRNLIVQLGQIDTANHFIVFLRKKSFASFTLPNTRWEKRQVEIPWHTLKEQILMPKILVREHLDLLHVPYFNVPIFYPKPYIVTIHDLTILHVHTGKVTNLPWLLYMLKRFGYYLILLIGLSRAKHILAVSEVTKQEIMDHFAINEGDITVTHEGIEKQFTMNNVQLTAKKRIVQNDYFLYVGNAYPHKNLEILIGAFQQYLQGLTLQDTERPYENLKLVLVGKDDFFYNRLKNIVKKEGIKDHVLFFGETSDRELKNLYSNALACIFPSLMEGFGLPGLEAMACGTPVLCSDIAVFHEIYKDAGLYFNPKSTTELINLLNNVVDKKNNVASASERGTVMVKAYSWNTMAMQTLKTFGL